MGTTGVTAIVTADWHLDAVTAGAERYDEILTAAHAIVDRAIHLADTRDVVFIFAGDLCDPDPPRCWRAASAAVEIAMRLESYNIPSVWITGNHDVLEDGHGSHTLMPLKALQRYDGFRSVVVDVPAIQGVTCGARGIRLLCFPYCARSLSYDPRDLLRDPNVPTPHLIVSHLMLEGIGPGSEVKDFARGRDVFLPVDDLRTKFGDVPIVNGHYHTGQLYRGIHIPGSIARLTFGEATNSPRFLEIDL